MHTPILNPIEKAIYDHSLHIEPVENDDSGAASYYELTCLCGFDAHIETSQPHPTETLRTIHARHVYDVIRRIFVSTVGMKS